MGSVILIQPAMDTTSRSDPDPAEPEAVDKIQQSMANGGQLDDLKSMTVPQLKHEFLRVVKRLNDITIGYDLTSGTSSSEWYSSTSGSSGLAVDSSTVYNLQDDSVISDLRNVLKRLNSEEHLAHCTMVFKSLRKSYFDAMIERLPLQELCITEPANKFLRVELEMKVNRWIQAAGLCFFDVFLQEKWICGRIFSDFGTGVAEECFIEIVRDSANNLLNFPEAVSSSNQPWERLGTILGLYDTFLSLLPWINGLFDSESTEAILSGAKATVSRLGDHIRRMLPDFEKAVLNDLLPILDDEKAIHPLTEKVIDYINLIVGHRKILTDLIKSMPPLKFRDVVIPVGELGDLKGRSHLALHLILIIVVLQLNLKGKSKQYEQVPLRHLFVANNVLYILHIIEGSPVLAQIIGDDYMRKLNLNVKEAMASYQDALLYFFREEGLYVTCCFSSRASKRELGKRLKSFNSQFKKIQEWNSSWVHDFELWEELRIFMVEKLIPAYKEFLHKFSNYIEHGETYKNNSQKINVKYSVEDLEDLLSMNFFIM